MKPRLSDFVAFVYIATITALLFIELQQFITITKAHPFVMGFAKFALLATFGECLKNRFGFNAKWIPNNMPIKAFVWGLFGIWITWAFTYADAGFRGLISVGLWPDATLFASGFWMNLFNAFSKSLWINLLSGYAFFMMFFHLYLDTMINGKCLGWPWELFGCGKEGMKWGKVVFLSLIFFWIPAHTITFMLPPEFRVIFAAYLSIALGGILTFASGR